MRNPERTDTTVADRFHRNRFHRVGMLVLVVSTVAAIFTVPRTAHAQEATPDPIPDVITHSRHPEPRAGVTAENVLSAEDVNGDPEVARIYDQVRQIPEIIDGLYCWCGCHEDKGYRSLLTCFEGGEMATHCRVCRGEAELAFTLNQRGATLEDIRSAIDAEFGR